MNPDTEPKPLPQLGLRSILTIASFPLFIIVPLYLLFLLADPASALQMLPPVVGLSIILFLFCLVLTVLISRRFIQFFQDLEYHPLIVTISLIICSYYASVNRLLPFTTAKGVEFLGAIFPYALITWILFPVIQSKWFVKHVKNRMNPAFFTILVLPIWFGVFMSGMAFVLGFVLSFINWLFMPFIGLDLFR